MSGHTCESIDVVKILPQLRIFKIHASTIIDGVDLNIELAKNEMAKNELAKRESVCVLVREALKDDR